jgi:signal transduction histidine kinase
MHHGAGRAQPRKGPTEHLGWSVALVAAAVALFMVFRHVYFYALGSVFEEEPRSLGDFLTRVGEDFLPFFSATLVMLCVIEPVRRLGPASGWRRIAALVVAVLAATFAASLFRALFFFAYAAADEDGSVGVTLLAYLPRFLALGGPLVAVGEFYRAEQISVEAMRAAETDRAVLEQQTLQARLKTLEAQIEPHFLFNTLANLRRLYETDAVAGEAMLGQLMRYLQVALPSMRDDQTTLGREAQLIRAYLELQQVRMGRRLAFDVDVAPALQSLRVPPMMLLTLVENAIKHGLAPLREGGRVDVAARIDGGELRLEVADTGRGFGGDTAGGGTGLANIRARLAAMFGAAAELTLAAREPRGLRATIRIPVQAPGATA